MGIEIEVNSLEDMCDLMCYNKIPRKKVRKVKEYEVWMEGYRVNEGSKPHEFIGKVKAETFEEACYYAVRDWCKNKADFYRYYDPKKQSYWGCRCYDNEKDSMYFD